MASLQIEMLSEDEAVVQICRMYWNCDEDGKFISTVAEVAKTYGLKSGDVSKIAYAGCNAYATDVVCPLCEEPFIFGTRSDYQQVMRYPNRNQICALCQEEELKAQQIQRETELENRRNRVRSTFSLESAKTPNIHDLTLEDAVYLLSFIRIAASEDLTIFGPVENAVERLSPTSYYSVEIIKHLMAKNLIFVHPDSSPDVFDFEEERVTYSVNKVLYVLPTSNDSEETSRFITQLQGTFRTREWWPYKWHEEKLFLWRKVALHECLEYMGYVLNKHQMPFKPGDKTRLTLHNLLEQYSVAQIYTMIWSSGERAAAFFQRGNVTRQHAANTIIGKIEGYGERAIAQEWLIKHGRRDFNCPQSMVSRVLFDTVFKIGDKGFNEPPRVFDLEDVNSDADEDNPSSETSTVVAT